MAKKKVSKLAVKASPKPAVKKSAKPAGKRELINTGTDKRYVRRDAQGEFEHVVDVGKSLSIDLKKKAKTIAKPGHGDKGDRKRK